VYKAAPKFQTIHKNEKSQSQKSLPDPGTHPKGSVFAEIEIDEKKPLSSRLGGDGVYVGTLKTKTPNGVWKEQTVAVKCLMASNEDHMKQLRNEYAIMLKAKGIKNVLTPSSIEVVQKELRIAMPLAELTFEQFILFVKDPTAHPLPATVKIEALPTKMSATKQLVLAFKELHALYIAHRDVKGSNVVLVLDGIEYLIKVQSMEDSNLFLNLLPF
jgi:serine/threonine protein kinase